MDEDKRLKIWQPFLLALMVAIGMLVGTQLDDELPEGSLLRKSTPDQGWTELLNAVRFVQTRYGEEVDSDSIAESTIRHLIGQLDPHSYYLTGMEYNYFKERMSGSYRGIGIEYEVINDTVYLTHILEMGAAAKVDLQTGDQVLAIDRHAVSGQQMTDMEIIKVWKATGDELDLLIKSVSNSDTITVSITKMEIPLQSVPVAEVIENDIGYIKIVRFADGTYKDFMEGLETLSQKGINHLIIDVRDNPGGSLQEVVKIVDQLIEEKGQLLLYTKGKHVKKTEYKSTGRVFHPLDRIVVLINERSVSASEVLAGVLQDLGRAEVIGRRSFGKALVQEMYQIGEEDALNLSIGKYYLPSGRHIQRSYVDREAYKEEMKERVVSCELFEADSLFARLDSVKITEDGRKLAIGEGIVPDHFVPADSLYYSNHWKESEHDFHKKVFLAYVKGGGKLSSNEIPPDILNEFIPADLEQEDVSAWQTFLSDTWKITKLWIEGREKSVVSVAKQYDKEIQAAINILSKKAVADQAMD